MFLLNQINQWNTQDDMRFREENHERLFSTKEEEGLTKRRWVQDVTDHLQMSASDTEHIAYYRVVFKKVV
jgi:hypothetical protein